ncbi:hypothetical protein SeMB42_g04339 [Synchytrium endobioticum]|uniref:Late endosomal/lysosomal adaptor and MAPK and MTOR activator 5 n=1 Tax=Synchytrium endobioticum TaxID=286115 RepID=A0A507CZR2_9FUNG|nr:hypothetical protein SeLEV6574_g06473 [Synchytrium endobioticum]TPX44390.1 hypothetical protein SeMB42_g04339 [Synchytrium endobioticum]
MEKDLTSALDALANTPKVKGVIAVDSQGLPLGHRGSAEASASPLFESISSKATKIVSQISNGTGLDVLITVESDMQTLYIQRNTDVTIGIYKASQ